MEIRQSAEDLFGGQASVVESVMEFASSVGLRRQEAEEIILNEVWHSRSNIFHYLKFIYFYS